MRKLALFGNRHQEGYFPQLQRLLIMLSERGFEVWVQERFSTYLEANGVVFPDGFEVTEDFPMEAECVVSIGGDGTFLKAAQWVGAAETPILGINTGHLGFLASYSLEEMEELTDVVARDLGQRERRAVLEVRSSSLPDGFWPYALNEVAVQKGETASMVTVHAEIDGYFLADYLSDGLVVATPTGSTAYNLSAGGPILQPTLECLVLSPIAPHSLTMRPLVVSGESEIHLRAYSRMDYARVSLDGRSFMLRCGEDELEITKAPFAVVVLRRPDASFSRLLRNKLLWGKR